MAAMSDGTEEKYVVFKREEFLDVIRSLPAHQEMAHHGFQKYEIPDAVVIRRQDLFASPCLATYASMISLVAKNIDDSYTANELLGISDYFEDQARLAAEEGHKLPDR
jgi:hypothetical protein